MLMTPGRSGCCRAWNGSSRGPGSLTENLVLDRFIVQGAGIAERALEMLARTRQDAMVVDLCLPALSGLDLMRRPQQMAGIRADGIH
jgi:DNA-binding response OmpR family regulator